MQTMKIEATVKTADTLVHPPTIPQAVAGPAGLLTAILVTLLLAGCSSTSKDGAVRDTVGTGAQEVAGSLEGPRQADSTQAAGGMSDMKGMPGMEGKGMMEQMQAHMRMMETSNSDSLSAMLGMHRQTVANMLSQTKQEMRKMNMNPDAKWTALTDSLREDLIRIPEMGTGQVRSFMPAHRARVMRLMEMHRAMMSGM